MKITAFDKERNLALDNMIEERKYIWNPIQDILNQYRNNIGELMAKRDFAEKLGYDDSAEKIKQINEDLTKARSIYEQFKEEKQPLADKLDKEMAILESLKTNY